MLVLTECEEFCMSHVHCAFDFCMTSRVLCTVPDGLMQLQDKATLLTSERKKRGKTIPEGLATSDDIRVFKQLASHVVG